MPPCWEILFVCIKKTSMAAAETETNPLYQTVCSGKVFKISRFEEKRLLLKEWELGIIKCFS